MKKKLSILVAGFAILAAVLLPAAAFAAQSDFYGEWEYHIKVGEEYHWDASASVSETKITFAYDGRDGDFYEDGYIICEILSWDTEQVPGDWGGDASINASGIITSVDGELANRGMSIGDDCFAHLELSEEGYLLDMEIDNDEETTGIWTFGRVEGGEEPGDGEPGDGEEKDEDNPKTGDINIVLVAASSLVAIAGAVIAGIALKKSTTKH